MKRFLNLILLVLVIAMFSLWINPLRADVTELTTNRDELDAQLKTIIGSPTAEPDVVISDIDQQFLEQAIPKGFDQEKLIKLLNSIASENIVKLDNISFNKTIADESAQINMVQLSLTGSSGIENLLGFIRELESNNRTFIIKNINIGYSATGGAKRANFTLNIESYFS